MEKCRLCYQEVGKEKLELHVSLCGEITKLKKGLGLIVEKMGEYSRQAYLMQSNLNTNVTAQKYTDSPTNIDYPKESFIRRFPQEVVY